MTTRLLVGSVAVLVCLGFAIPAWAGIYHPSEPTGRLPAAWPDFKDRLDELRSIASPPSDPKIPPFFKRVQYLERVAFLEAMRDRGLLTVADRVNLSAYYLRLLQPDKARDILEAVPEGQRNFMVLANLAQAYFQSDMLDRAILTQQQALDSWPDSWPGLTHVELAHYRRCERHFLSLMKARKQEGPPRPGIPVAEVDAIFPGVKFVGADGEYQIGEIALSQWDKLPVESDRIVSQMVLWLPFDDRLYWLLAEVLNAQGDPLRAGELMDELEYKRQFRPHLLHKHRQILRDDDVLKTLHVLKTNQAAVTAWFSLWFVAPRGAGLAPGVAGIFPEAGWIIVVSSRPTEGGPVATDPVIPTNKASYLPDIGAVLIGLAVGVVVGVLLTLQMRAMKKPQPPAAN